MKPVFSHRLRLQLLQARRLAATASSLRCGIGCVGMARSACVLAGSGLRPQWQQSYWRETVCDAREPRLAPVRRDTDRNAQTWRERMLLLLLLLLLQRIEVLYMTAHGPQRALWQGWSETCARSRDIGRGLQRQIHCIVRRVDISFCGAHF